MSLTSDSFPYPNATEASKDALANGPDGALPNAAGDLMQRVVHGAHETIDRLAATAAPQVQRLGEGVASASDALTAKAGQLRETRDEWAKGLRSTVRENPLATVVVALALGAVIARFTR